MVPSEITSGGAILSSGEYKDTDHTDEHRSHEGIPVFICVICVHNINAKMEFDYVDVDVIVVADLRPIS
jgi:hypothetical protein